MAEARAARREAPPATSVRVLALLLLALDIGGAGWLAFAPSPRQRDLPPTDPGVAELVLLSELPDAAPANTELATPAQTALDLAGDECRSIGPFASAAEARAALATLAPKVARLRTRETHDAQARGFWVYVPALGSREHALATARDLAAKNVRDYFVVTSGDRQNTISLGVFRDPANAERRRAEIAALGLAAKTEPRSDDEPAYWLDIALLDGQGVDWKTLLARAAELHETTIACF